MQYPVQNASAVCGDSWDAETLSGDSNTCKASACAAQLAVARASAQRGALIPARSEKPKSRAPPSDKRTLTDPCLDVAHKAPAAPQTAASATLAASRSERPPAREASAARSALTVSNSAASSWYPAPSTIRRKSSTPASMTSGCCHSIGLRGSACVDDITAYGSLWESRSDLKQGRTSVLRSGQACHPCQGAGAQRSNRRRADWPARLPAAGRPGR